MKNKVYKINLFILSFALFASMSVVFAGSEETVITNVANSLLSVISWVGYAIALGALLFLGIKYIMSSASDKADLKGKLPAYMIGIAMIVFCFAIAQFVANIAGNDTAEDIVNVGTELGNHFSGGSSGTSSTGGSTGGTAGIIGGETLTGTEMQTRD